MISELWAGTFPDLFSDPDATPMSAEEAVRYRTIPSRCLCGRFAKYVGEQHYYNGQFDCGRSAPILVFEE